MSVVGDLGEFLRASRARVDPGDVGLPDGVSGRRVPGLRREEVAVLAGVSADYYARLEQGRERNPSPQMLDAIGRALRLSGDARGHLYRLAGLTPYRSPDSSGATVHPSFVELLESFPLAAAYVLGPAFDVLATNSIAAALLSPFDPERNMPRILFTHPRAREVFPEWSTVTTATVSALRLNAGLFPHDASIGALVEELQDSPSFRTLWDAQGVAALSRAYKVFRHAEVGQIELTYQSFDVHDAPGQQLLVGSPAVGSASERAVGRLAAMGASA